MNKYQKYIDELALTEQTAYGKCYQTCLKMQETFPELALIRGHYFCITWGERMHYWLEDKESNIIDPTAIQFPSKGKGKYEPWNDEDNEPTGMCPNCGDFIYDGSYTHKKCEQAFIASLEM